MVTNYEEERDYEDEEASSGKPKSYRRVVVDRELRNADNWYLHSRTYKKLTYLQTIHDGTSKECSQSLGLDDPSRPLNQFSIIAVL